jgi:hypothetical protein
MTTWVSERSGGVRTSIANPIFFILIGGIVAASLFTSVYLQWVSISTEILACIAALCIGIMPSHDPLLRLYKLFLIGEFCVLPLWQLAARDSIYLPLLPESSPAVFLWFSLNIMGLFITALVFRLLFPARPAIPQARFRVRVNAFAYPMASIALAGVAFIYLKLGGYRAIVSAYQQRVQSGVTEFDPLNGLGSIQALANTAPLWIFVCLTFRPWKGRLLKVAGVVQLAALGWLSSGVFGNRQGMLFVLIFAFFLQDQMIKPFSLRLKKTMLLAVCGLAIVLMPLKFGIDYTNLSKFSQNFAEKRQLNLSMGPLSFLLFRDLSRFDVQATTLAVVSQPGYPLALGRSLAGAAGAIIPRFLWKDRPATFVEEKTEIVGSFESGNSQETTLLFGMPGELLVNFGIAGYLGSFLIPAFLVILLRKLNDRAGRWEPLRIILMPLPFLFFLFDSNVLAYYAMRWIVLFALPLSMFLERE